MNNLVSEEPLLSDVLEGFIHAIEKLDVDEPVSVFSSCNFMDGINLNSNDSYSPVVKFERGLLSKADEVFDYIPSCIWELHSYAINGIVERDKDSVQKAFRDWRNRKGGIF